MIQLYSLLVIFYGAAQIVRYGLVAGIPIACSRVLWTFPIILGLFWPASIERTEEDGAAQVNWLVLWDDSESSRQGSEAVIQSLQESVASRYIGVQTEPFSGFFPDPAAISYSSLLREAARMHFGYERIFVVTDGVLRGAYDLSASFWEPVFLEKLSFVYSGPERQHPLVSLRQLNQQKFYFVGGLADLELELERSGIERNPFDLQVQVMDGDQVLSSHPVQFVEGQVKKQIQIPLTVRRNQILSIRLLMDKMDKDVIQNSLVLPGEILVDTIPVLHLLGAPSPDGRFVRRFLQSEAKFDLISFFILRDPEDHFFDIKSEELSLIPFPVDRIFDKDLHRFKLLVIQNFNLSTFLSTQYAQNIVQFIRDGGKVLFIGGDRAFQPEDQMFLESISPFKSRFAEGRYFEDDQSFEIQSPSTLSHLGLATPLFEAMAGFQWLWPEVGSLKGLHPLEIADPQKGVVLLETKDQRPVMVASYPDRGRVVWVLTDSLWKVANRAFLKPYSRQQYSEIMTQTTRWLLDSDLDDSLRIENVQYNQNQNQMEVDLELKGNMVSYLDIEQAQIELCAGPKMPLSEVLQSQRAYTDSLLLKMVFPRYALENDRACRGVFHVQQEAFGNLELPFFLFRESFIAEDAVNGGAIALMDHVAQKLPQLTLYQSRQELQSSIQTADLADKKMVSQMTTVDDFFWPIHTWYGWLFLLAPIEIFFRRLFRTHKG